MPTSSTSPPQGPRYAWQSGSTESEAIRISPWTLRFSDPALEATFWRDGYRSSRRVYIGATTFALFMNLAFLWLDPMVASEAVASDFAVMRWGLITPLMLAAIWALMSPRMQPLLERYPQQSHLIVVTSAFVPLIAMAWRMLDGADDRTTLTALLAYLLSLLVVLHVSRLRFAYAAAFVALTGVIGITFPYVQAAPSPFLIAVGASFLIAFNAIILSISYVVERATKQGYADALRFRLERERADALLRNILPESIAAALQSGEGPKPRRHEAVTVLFADIVGFTSLAERTPPDALVALLHGLFSEMDTLTRQAGVEKIKTIGDAYMVVAGAPEERPDHIAVMADVALALLALIDRQGEPPLSLRIGIHTGPVVAGVIGQHKFAYDVWGDTVNMASRLESHGEPGRIHISMEVAEALAGTHVVERRGPTLLRGRGTVETAWLLARGTT